jgi:hypothetical protein
MDEFIDNINCPLVIRTAALRGLTMMKKYYSLTDESVVFRIAMSMNYFYSLSCAHDGLVLHPKHKTSYFVKAKWPREWIQTAENLVRHNGKLITRRIRQLLRNQ